MTEETNKPSKLKQWFWGFITIAVVALYWLYKQVTKPDIVIDNNTVIENTVVADSLRNVIQNNQEQTDAQVQALNDSIAMYQFIINENEQTINELKSKTNEKSNNVVYLTGNELYQFLSDRYKDSVPTK
jgi:hypothetical protein